MAAKWLAKVGFDKPFVVKNCKYAMRIMGVHLNRETCINTVKAIKSNGQ